MNSQDQGNTVKVSRNMVLTCVLFAFATGVFIGSGFTAMITPAQTDKAVFNDRDRNFTFIRTASAARDEGEKPLNAELVPFRYKIKALIDEKISRNQAKAASVYFRDLNNGNWFGIGEKEKFAPRSLLKLPLMMAYFKWAESNTVLLRKRLTYTPRPPSPGSDRNKKTELEPGRQYAVNDLIFRMIADDDDGAYSLLSTNIPAARLDNVFRDLNVEYDPHNDNDSLSLRAFASFYRVLFNASYLNEEMSEKALRYLAKSSLNYAMASAIPLNVEIAGKFGERAVKTVENGKEVDLSQMHEFGIIYHPRRPFLIGVMARGDDRNSLVRTIHDITKLVYEEVDEQS